MKRMLKKINPTLYYFEKNTKIIGIHANISGDVSGIRGDVSGISGDVNGISGDVNGINGDVSKCEITIKERVNGIKIEELLESR